MDVSQALRVGVTGHDDVGFFGQQRLKCIEKLFLRALFVRKKLHIVNQQQIERMVAVLELIESFALVRLHHVRHKLLCVDVKNLRKRLVLKQFIANRMHQVRFAQTHAAVNEQGVIKMPRSTRDMHGGGAGHAVSGAFNQRAKSQPCVKPVFWAVLQAFFPQLRQFFHRDGF